MRILVDTNVLIDVLEKRQPWYSYSARVWNAVEQHAVMGYVSAISFNNTFYLLRKKLSIEGSLIAVREVRATFDVVPLDAEIIDAALALSDRDFEDAIQAASARSITADHIVTRNVKDFAKLGVSCLTPEEFLALIGA